MKSPLEATSERRFAAVVLPELLVEVALCASRKFQSSGKVKERKLAVLCSENEEASARARVDAVSPRARALGVYPGQTVAEATSFCADLELCSVRREELLLVLASVAEVAKAFGTPVALELESLEERRLPDTVWVDTSGGSGLFGGEEALALELAERVRLLGFTTRVVLASGPRTAQVLARSGVLDEGGVRVVPQEGTVDALSELSIFSLGLEAASEEFLVRLGIASVSALAKMPPESLLPRLGKNAARVWDLVQGRECLPLRPFVFSKTLQERCEWETPLEGLTPLYFALHGLIAQLAARLSGRGEAAKEVKLELELESREGKVPSVELSWVLSTPLWRPLELERVLRSRLEKTTLQGRIQGVTLSLGGLVEANAFQMDLGQGDRGDESSLALLLEELKAEVGGERLGLLDVTEGHRPEKRSRLRGWFEKLSKRPRSEAPRLRETNRLTRLFREPLALPIGLVRGENLALGARLFRVARIDFAEKMDGVEWWTENSTSRDYYWLWLEEGGETLEALVYRDQRDQRVYLQGFSD